jgi:UDP-N-acetylmuramate: L-alanyl-gamma-D-glutamyl-meso-diaminopimelate ligase
MTNEVILEKGAHVHFMGICGTAMASLAGIMKTMGFKVTGSDLNVYPPMSTQLEKVGIQIMQGYKKENLDSKPQLVIVGNVISKNHEEAQALLASQIPYTSLPNALGRFVIGDRESIVVCGTHGKTTTTSLMAWTAQICRKAPGFLIGGIPVNYDFSFQVPEKNLFVIEGDEYDTAFFDKVPKFVHYKPKYAILTSVEFDHADIYRDLDHVKSAFEMLLQKISSDGFLVYNSDEANVLDVVQKHSKPLKSFSYGERSGDYQFKNLKLNEKACFFEIEFRGKRLGSFELPLFGRYNILNALSVFAVAHQTGYEIELIQQAWKSFKGVKRRQEIIGTPNQITVIEDFAHHPTAVKVTLQGIRERFQGSKIFAVFEPRSATSRRGIFQNDYVSAFSEADQVVLAGVFNSQALGETERLSPEAIVDTINSQVKANNSQAPGPAKARVFNEVDQIVSFLKAECRPSDVVVIMSNGAFGGIYSKVLQALR